jgi:hypothetical protein
MIYVYSCAYGRGVSGGRMTARSIAASERALMSVLASACDDSVLEFVGIVQTKISMSMGSHE